MTCAARKGETKMGEITRSSAAAQKRQNESLAAEVSQENSPTNAIVEHLQRQVANAFVLYTNYKHYHWQTYGPLFRDLHLMFDEFAKAVLATIDDFAERVRMIGQDPVSRPQEIEAIASVNVAEHDQTLRQMIEEADANLLVVIKEMRSAVRDADGQDDPGTVDLFSRHVQIHEKHEWWLRDILEKRDGLTD
jgi:starvation-inducible DNA-binding protein